MIPMPGEVDPKDARRVAIHAAAVARLRIEAANKALASNATSSAEGKKK